MVLIMNGLPAPALHLLRGHAGVIVPTLVVPVDVAVRPGHPRQLRDRVDQGVKLLFAETEVFLSLFPVLDIRAGADPAHDPSRAVLDRQGAAQVPAVTARFLLL